MHCVNMKTLATCGLATFLAVSISLGQESSDGWFVPRGGVGPDVNRAFQWAPELSSNELELYFGSTRAGAGDLYVARRAVVGAAWESVEPIVELNSTTREAAPSISADGRQIYFVSDRTGRREIHVATRDGAIGPFETPLPLGLDLPGFRQVGPEISSDGLELFFHARDNGPVNIWVAWRDDPEEPFENFRALTELSTGCNDIQPSLSGDGRTLFWSDDLCGRIWTANRPAVRDEHFEPIPFGDSRPLEVPVNVPTPNGGAPSIASSWPEAGAELYFVRNGQIHFATWELPPEAATFLRGDCTDDGEVNLSDAVCILEGLFAGGPGAGCRAVANVNVDSAVNIADASYLLNYLFVGGAAPAAPFPECGSSELEVDEDLGCETSCVE